MASVDDVHNLLNDVNSITLKRMEDKTDAMHNLLNAVNTGTLKRMEEKTDAISGVALKRIEEKADRATGAERDFQLQVRAQLGEIDAKLHSIITAMTTPSSPGPGSPTPTPPS